MLYKITHTLKDRCPWIWEIIEKINAFLFYIRYGRKLDGIDDILERYNGEYVIDQLKESNINKLVCFFQEQPESAFEYFRPHAFDRKTLRKLQRNRSFLAFVVEKENVIVGYFFLRCFFIGKCFRGKIVDFRFRNMGIAKMMGRIMTDIVEQIDVRSFSTISPNNLSSLKSSDAVVNLRVIKQLENGDYYVEYLGKK